MEKTIPAPGHQWDVAAEVLSNLYKNALFSMSK